MLFRHVDGVIHDLSYREAIRAVSRTLNDKAIAQALSERYGPKLVSQHLEEWLRNVAAGPAPATDLTSKLLRWGRVGLTGHALGYSLRTMAVQFLGITNVAARLGKADTIKGIAGMVYETRGTFFKKVEWIHEKSAFMSERTTVFDRDIAVMARKMKPAGSAQQKAQDAAFYGIALFDRVVSYSGWLGTYRKALAEGQAEADAVRLADQMVRATQGSGRVQDQASITLGGEAQRLFTSFYTFFIANQNMLVDAKLKAGQIRNRKNALAASTYATEQAMLLLVIPAILGGWMLDGGPDDDESWWDWAAKVTTGYGLGGIAYVRDFARYIETGYEYKGPAGSQLLTAITKLYTQVEQGEVDKQLVKSAVTAASIGLHIPGGAQVNRLIEAVDQLQEGAPATEVAAEAAGIRRGR